MPTLSVTDFSCIGRANLELAPLTILIGPQASGKSVLSKLTSFCYAPLSRHGSYFFDERRSLQGIVEALEKDFADLFPPTAWGAGKFVIEFTAGQYSMRIARRLSRRTMANHVEIRSSDFFSATVEEIESKLENDMRKVESSKKGTHPQSRFDVLYAARSAYRARFKKQLGPDYPEFQLFVPAGRSFFTSFGKAVPVFEHGKWLDPITLEFGRLFTQIRERSSYTMIMEEDESPQYRAIMRELLGGEIKRDREGEYLATPDGRKIPFFSLSSGQQELLPLLFTLSLSPGGGYNALIFIEEPEAHLFPASQAALAQFLATFVGPPNATNRMMITTHSPYILGKINNLLKAGRLAHRSRVTDQKLGKIIPRDSWLRESTTTAYAIHDGEVVSIMDDSGLVDAAYLDDISGDLVEEFQLLLDLENEINDAQKNA